MSGPRLLKELEVLGADLDHGTETHARSHGDEHETALRDLVGRALVELPAIIAPHYQKRGLLDAFVVVTVIALLALGARAAYLLSQHDPIPERAALRSRLTEGAPADPIDEGDLAGRTLLTLPVEPASYALLGDLPTRISAAVVPDTSPDVEPTRTVATFDDLVVLEAEATEGEVAVLVAVAPDAVESLLSALRAATVHLLRRPTPPTESRTSSASPTAPSG